MSTVSGGRRRAFRSRHHTPMGEGGKLAVIFVSIALVLFVLAVMLGNYLRGLAEDIIDETTEASTTEAEVYYANSPSEVIARGVLFGVDYSGVDVPEDESTDITEEQEPSDTAEQTEEDTEIFEDPVDFDSVSVTLREKDKNSGEMHLAYSSPISLEYSIDTSANVGLSEGLALIAENWGERTSVCGIFEVDYPNRPEASRGIMRAYEIALVCELIDAGIDEIMLIGFSSNAEEGLSFISDIYEQKGRGTAIGLAFSFDLVNSVDANAELDAIAKKCGFLALDLCSIDVPALMSAETLITDRVSRTLAICREYSLRIILGCGETPDCESQTRAAIEAGADNIMTGLGIPEFNIEDPIE